MENPEEKNGDIFGEVADTTPVTNAADPTKRLYLLPESIEWFLAKNVFDKPKDVDHCTASIVVQFLSWQITAETQSVYMGSGTSAPGTLRNQMISRFHPVPEGFEGASYGQRTPCKKQFGENCLWCNEKQHAEKRFTRDNQPTGYFKNVIAPFMSKDKTVMLGKIFIQNDAGVWDVSEKVQAFEWGNFVRQGRTFSQILNDRGNEADKRFRIDKKTYAGYVSPVAIKITYSWATKNGKPDHSQFASWSVCDATPFPADAGGPDLGDVNHEWAIEMAKNDPAAWVNRDAYKTVDAAKAGQWAYDVFTGKVSVEGEVDLDTADFGKLLEVVGAHPDKFEGVINTSEFSYQDCDALRDIIKGVLNVEA
jgi:hypothetical protein